MSKDVHWITIRIAEAREHNASVTEAVSARIEKLLNGRLSERELPAAELASIATALIEDMTPTSPKAETEQ